MTVTELAELIDAHLRKLEADPGFNTTFRDGTHRFWEPGARRGGRFVLVTYVSYQGPSYLTRTEAEAYLAWLDAGNKGLHYAQQKEARTQS